MVVTSEAIAAYARACNDVNPRYFATGDTRAIAPPMFAAVVAWVPLIAALTDPELHADLLRLLHVGQEMRFYRPIQPGDEITAAATITAIEKAAGGEALTVELTASDRRGELLNQSWFSALIRGRRGGERRGRESAAPVQVTAPIAEVTEVIDPDQTLRYAEASGDRNPIHTDPAVARMAGLPGIIVHGLCTMAFAVRALVDNVGAGDPARLERVAARFARPVFPGETVTTAIWPLEGAERKRRYSFATTNREGLVVIRDGLAEIADAAR
jgi:acyl dehydratase